MLQIAIQHALGRGGVAVVVDAGRRRRTARRQNPTGTSALGGPRARARPADEQVEALADALNTRRHRDPVRRRRRPRRARRGDAARRESCKAPVGHALGGKEWIQYDNPYDVGMSGLLGYGACYEATHEADLLVLLGTDFPYDDFLPDGARSRRSTTTRPSSGAASRSTSG